MMAAISSFYCKSTVIMRTPKGNNMPSHAYKKKLLASLACLF